MPTYDSTPYDVGDLVRLTVEFRNAAGTLTNPTTITFETRVHRDGVIDSYVYGTDVEVVKVGGVEGTYYFDLLLAESGAHAWRWQGQGACVAAEEGVVEVKRSRFE